MAKTPTDIRSLARSHTKAALSVLRGIMNEKEAPAAARVSAAIGLLDRGWGKPSQVIEGDKENPLIIREVIERIVIDAQAPDGEDVHPVTNGRAL